MAPMPMGRTQSIVAVDRRSGQMGAAVLSESFSVGSKAIWTEPGVGVVVTQGALEPTYGSLGLALLKGGKSPAHALKSLIATDPHPGVRQVMMIDSRGRTAAHTGKSCLPEAGFLSGRGFCVQGSFADRKRVWRHMAAAFRGERGSLAGRMVAALKAGEEASSTPRGGRGYRSAAVMVVAAIPTNTPWEGKIIDLRVESSGSPLKELHGLLRLEEAYGHAANGEDLISRGEPQRGEREFSKAISLAPENAELRLWMALSMLQRGEVKAGQSMLRSAAGRERDVKALVKALSTLGMVGEPPKAHDEPGRA